MHSDYTLRQVSWQQAEDKLRLLREQIFIKEQLVPEELEWDGLDDSCIHILVEDKHGNPVATARLLDNGHIGRMGVLSEHRHHGIGTAMLQYLTELCWQHQWQAHLSAQTHALGFYQQLGFIVNSEEYLDANIPHKDMILEAT